MSSSESYESDESSDELNEVCTQCISLCGDDCEDGDHLHCILCGAHCYEVETCSECQ